MIKKTTIMVISLLLSIVIPITASASPTIMIDAGHGGKEESGAVSDGYLEKDWNLDTSLACVEELKKHGIDVLMTRDKDIYVSLEDRSNLANKYKVDYFVSIHHNANSNREVDRGEVIHSIFKGKGRDLANNIKKELNGIGQSNVKIYSRMNASGQDYYSVIRKTMMPSIIVEVCFIDNEEDRKIADTKEEREKNGVAIAHGIMRQIGIPFTNHITEKPNNPLDKSSILLEPSQLRGVEKLKYLLKLGEYSEN